MMNSESEIQKEVRLAATQYGFSLWRNNVGAAYRSKLGPKGVIWLKDGSVHIKFPILVKFGLHEGSSDLIGFRRMTVTPEMVGQTLPIFAGVECKTKGGKESKQQKNWKLFLLKERAISIIARSAEDLGQGVI